MKPSRDCILLATSQWVEGQIMELFRENREKTAESSWGTSDNRWFRCFRYIIVAHDISTVSIIVLVVSMQKERSTKKMVHGDT